MKYLEIDDNYVACKRDSIISIVNLQESEYGFFNPITEPVTFKELEILLSKGVEEKIMEGMRLEIIEEIQEEQEEMVKIKNEKIKILEFQLFHSHERIKRLEEEKKSLKEAFDILRERDD